MKELQSRHISLASSFYLCEQMVRRIFFASFVLKYA